MAVTDEQILSTARLGAKVIEFQLDWAGMSVTEALYKIWPFGYMYGAFEALARRYEMDVDEAQLLIAMGFVELLDQREGEKRLALAAQRQTNSFFIEGRAHGFDDFHRFTTEKAFRPLTLMNFFAFGKPAPLSEA